MKYCRDGRVVREWCELRLSIFRACKTRFMSDNFGNEENHNIKKHKFHGMFFYVFLRDFEFWDCSIISFLCYIPIPLLIIPSHAVFSIILQAL